MAIHHLLTLRLEAGVFSPNSDKRIKNCIDNIFAIRNKTFRAVPELYDKPDTSTRDIFEEGINDGLVFLEDNEEKEEQ